MAVNRNWVKTDGRSLEYAPTWLRTDAGIVVNPTDEQYRAAGWFKNARNAPETREGYTARVEGYETRYGQIYAVYAYDAVTPPPAIPKRYSKKRFSLALAKRGIFQAFDEWAGATEVIPGSGLTVKRVLADSWYMSDVDDEFKAVKAVAEAKFGADRIAEVLAESEDEEW